MFLGAAVAIVLATAEAPPVVDRAEAAAREVLARRYQRTLPIEPTPQLGGKAGQERAAGGKRPKAGPRRPRSAPDHRDDAELRGGALGGIVRLIVYVILGVALVMVLMWLIRDLRRGASDAVLEGDEVPEPTIDRGVIERPIGDADELARDGRYAEAIHTLLLRTLAELVRATRTRVPASLTSREILARVPLVPEARTALQGLVTAVELSWFGDDVPAAADYERCRREFQRFADAYRGAAA